MSVCQEPELTGPIVLPGEPQYDAAREDGFTLGGGRSILSRPWGLMIDSLLEMVDADGRVLHANAERHADLLWASRGR